MRVYFSLIQKRRGRSVRILFVTKNLDFFVPLGLSYLSAVAKQKGHETQLAIMDREDVLEKINLWSPKVIAYSGFTGEHRYYLELNKEIKKKYDVFTIMGGPHATFYPECLEQSPLGPGSSSARASLCPAGLPRGAHLRMPFKVI